MSGKLGSSGRLEGDDELCDNCKTLDSKKLSKLNERSLDATLSKMTLDDTKKHKEDMLRKAEQEKKKRREIDAYNNSSRSPKKDSPDSYGSIFSNRKEDSIDIEKKKKYKDELVVQMRDKKALEEIEKEKQKKKELEELRQNKEEIAKKNKMEADLKIKKNKEHQEFLKNQMRSPQSSTYKATLSSDNDQVFMSRLLSTAERKKRQLEEARERKRTQLDTISDKRERIEFSKREDHLKAERERKENEAKIKQEQKEALEKKRKQQEENRSHLQKQMEDKKQRDKEVHIDSIPFIFGTESQRIAAIKKHASKCQRCGRLIEEFGTTKFLNMGRKPSMNATF